MTKCDGSLIEKIEQLGLYFSNGIDFVKREDVLEIIRQHQPQEDVAKIDHVKGCLEMIIESAESSKRAIAAMGDGLAAESPDSEPDTLGPNPCQASPASEDFYAVRRAMHTPMLKSSEISDIDKLITSVSESLAYFNDEFPKIEGGVKIWASPVSYHCGGVTPDDLEAILSILRTHKPVSIKNIGEKLRTESWTAPYPCERLCEFAPCQCADDYAKFILKTAGVSYVD